MKRIVLVGSSIFEQWTTVENAVPKETQDVNINNYAVGGTMTAYWVENIEEVLRSAKPDIIWFYCGSNDFNDGIAESNIIDNIRMCRNLVSDFSTEIQFAYFSIIKAPQKFGKLEAIDFVNSEVRRLLFEQDLYVECNDVLFGEESKIREFYVEDDLHLTSKAYDVFAEYVKPLLASWIKIT